MGAGNLASLRRAPETVFALRGIFFDGLAPH